MMEEMTEETTEEITKTEKKYKQEEEKCMLQEKVYIGQFSKGEESNTGSDYSGYSYFGEEKENFQKNLICYNLSVRVMIITVNFF